ncbi:MAG: hypothetical protein KF847_18045 [Pirellulales bacterium]|nr:hypothetical protein [Pirellulales bacterium]
MATTTLSDCSVVAAQPLPAGTWQPASPVPAMGNWQMVPRCTIEFKKCAGGFKLSCRCEDEVACGALQNLCRMLSQGLCSLCCCQNGLCLAQCNLTCGNCVCECTEDGCCITCTSGDAKCCEILQACCDCFAKCCESGCCCYVCFNNTPVCCATC